MTTYNELPGPIEGYKILNKDLTCREYQFKLGELNILDNQDPLVLCKNGFDFCKHPSGVWSYYNSGRIFKIRAYGVIDIPEEPGADFKLVCRKIELIEEITPRGDSNTGDSNTGDRNTGYRNTGYRNTGNRNTGDRNTGDSNTGDSNTGNSNTGDGNTGNSNTGNSNTGNSNTGDGNTGNSNTGDGNTGNSNTGDRNTGNGNCTDYSSGFFCNIKPKLIFFNKPIAINRENLDFNLINDLSTHLMQDEKFDYTQFLALPNATVARIKELHKAHIEARKNANTK